MSAFLRASEHEVYVGVAIGDKTLHTIQSPAFVFLVVACLEHHALEVRTCVRFSKVHRHCLTGTNTWDIFLALLLVAKLIESLYTVLKAPDVLETGVGSRNNLRCHRIWCDRHVETAVAAWHRNAPKTSLACGIEVFECLRCIYHASVNEVWTFEVNILRVWLDDVSGDVASNFEHTLVVLNSVVEVNGSVLILFLVDEVSLLQFDYSLHLRVVEVELKLWMVGIIVCHN